MSASESECVQGDCVSMRREPSRVDELTGAPGELIDRLLAAVDLPEDRDRQELTLVLASNVVSLQRREGGALEVDDMVEVNELSHRDDLADELRRRMLGLADSRRGEDALVRALRDRITRHCEVFAWTDEPRAPAIAQRWRASVNMYLSGRVIGAWTDGHRLSPAESD